MTSDKQVISIVGASGFLADYSHYDGGQDTIMKAMNK